MPLLSLLLFGLAVAAVAVGWKRTGDVASPGTLVIFVWGVTLALYFLDLFPYAAMSSRAALLILGSLAGLLTGIGAGDFWVSRGVAPEGPEAAPRVRGAERWITAYSLLGLAGFVWYVAEVASLLGLSAFRQAARIRWALANKTIPSEYLFLELFCIVAPLVALAFVLAGTKLRRRALILPGFCAAVLWLTTDRTHFFTLVLTALLMILFHLGRNVTLVQVARIVGIGAVLLVLNFWLVGAWLGKTPANLGVELAIPARASTLSLGGLPVPRYASDRALGNGGDAGLSSRLFQKFSTLYLYATGSYAAFSLLVAEPPSGTGGAHTFYPILRGLARVHLYSGPLPDPIPEYRVITDPRAGRKIEYNAYTYLYYAYNDFGDFGLLLVPLLVGAASGASYGWVRRCRSAPLALLLTAQLAFGLMMSIFVDKFNNTATWYIAACSLAPFLALRGQSRRSPAPAAE